VYAVTNNRTSERTDISAAIWKVAELEWTISQFEHTACELGRQIESEEVRTRHYDPSDFAYSSFAKSARDRRERLRATIRRLKMELEFARGQSRSAARGHQHSTPPLSAPLDF
jgi:hypothetical protein